MDSIRVKREGATVQLLAGGVSGFDLTFDYTTPGPFYGALAAQEIQNGLANLVRGIRETAYEDGWRDAKAHRTKQSWFSSLLRRG